MEGYKIPFSCGRIAWKYKPRRDGGEIMECQKVGHYKTVEATPQQIFKLICDGRCWRAGIFKQGATQTRDKDFSGARLIALDFDEYEATPQELVEYCQSRGIEPNFWYYSFSQGKKPNNNFRLVWILDEVITPEAYKELIVALLNDAVFKAADQSCKNIGRLWFGTQNGGQFIKDEAIAYSKFDIFPRQTAEKKQGGRKKGEKGKEAEVQEQPETDQTFIMPKQSFDWNYYLSGVCDLWDKWRKKVYLKYYQRLLLFSELKCLKYDKSLKHSLLDEVMVYYDADLYAGSKCNREEIQYFLSSPKTKAFNKLVAYNGKEYTIAEWFLSGDYLTYRQKKRETRITREQLQKEADDKIPQMLKAKDIQYIECQTEAGKTERILDYLASIDLTQTKVIYSIPTYILIDEFIGRLKKKGIPESVIFCPRKIEYTAEEQIYLDMGFPECVAVNNEMIARKKELAMVEDENRKGLFILTHAALTHLKNITASQIIIDENIEDCLVKRYVINYSALWTLKAFIYTKDEILKLEPRNIEIKGDTTEEKIAFIENEIEAVNRDLDYIIDTVRTAEPQTKIEGIDKVRLHNYINAYKLTKDDKAKAVLENIGQLKNATMLSVGENKYKQTRYLYFEIASNMLPTAIENGISVSLFTGTPKLKQLEAGLPEELRGKIRKEIIDRADPLGNIYQWLCDGASGSKSSIEKTFDYAINELDKLGVDWTEINLLTLKACRDIARDKGFKIPTTASGEDIYIENCAGIDDMKGEDLIVIGKADIPKNAYLDMLHDGNLSDRQMRETRPIDNTGVEAYIWGFTEPELWELQAEQIRLPLEQAVGRARTLWYDCNVYVFCDFPVRNVKDPTHYKRGVK